VLVLGGCAQRLHPNPLEGQYRYTCCNVRYERERVAERNLQQGSLLPAGTRVRIDEIRKNRITFKPDGAPILMLVFVGREGYLSLDEYLERLFVTEDQRPAIEQLPKDVSSAVRQARVLPGMTRDQVLMALGYPPVDLTPVLSSPNWRYFLTRREVLEVFFESDTVVRVSQQTDAEW
jgi:hypothetical protein